MYYLCITVYYSSIVFIHYPRRLFFLSLSLFPKFVGHRSHFERCSFSPSFFSVFPFLLQVSISTPSRFNTCKLSHFSFWDPHLKWNSSLFPKPHHVPRQSVRIPRPVPRTVRRQSKPKPKQTIWRLRRTSG